MFNIKQSYQLDCPITKSEFIKYHPTSLSNINNENSIITINVGREDSYHKFAKFIYWFRI